LSRTVRIDAPGDGQWVMDHVAGVFSPGYDHSFVACRDGQPIGGITVCKYLGNSVTLHMAGDDKHWCSRDLLWFTFNYVFDQLGCYKALAPLRSDQDRIIAMDTRGGWSLEAVVRDAYAPGVHMLIIGMTKASCPWLKYKPRNLDQLVA
jgi:hypothetical protein